VRLWILSGKVPSARAKWVRPIGSVTTTSAMMTPAAAFRICGRFYVPNLNVFLFLRFHCVCALLRGFDENSRSAPHCGITAVRLPVIRADYASEHHACYSGLRRPRWSLARDVGRLRVDGRHAHLCSASDREASLFSLLLALCCLFVFALLFYQ
jgi:hypothetical protein